jgi:hypothetical protein
MDRSLLRHAAVGASLFIAALVFHPSSADAAETAVATDPQLRDALTKLLTDPWEKSADGLVAADDFYRRAKGIAAGDPRVDFALALVQLRYLRFSEAEKTLTRLSTAAPSYWPATQAKIHLSILMKKHSQALTELDAYSRRVASTPDATPDAEARREGAEFIGSIFGYLEGPAAKLISQASVADVRGKVLERFDAAQRESFSTAFGSVTERFSQLSDDTQRTKAEGLIAQKEQKEIDLKRLQAEQAALAGDKADNRRQAKQAFDEAQAKAGELDQQIAPLDAAFARVAARAQQVRAEIAQIELSIAALVGEAQTTKDRALRDSLLIQANLLGAQSRGAQITLQTIEADGVQITAQRDVLLKQRVAVVEQYQVMARQLGVEAAKIGRTEKRNTVQQKEVVKPASGFTPQVQTKAAATASITSYVEFPLERERLRLLDSLR